LLELGNISFKVSFKNISYLNTLDPNSPEWLARLPMTKGAVRAMDTVTDFVGNIVN